MSTKETILSLGEIFSESHQYLIPAYQRNYDWGVEEVNQLMDDINDMLVDNKDKNYKNYYLGTLVVFEKEDGKLEVVDGQQRLTTLNILKHALRIKLEESKELDKNCNLSFQIRDQSNQDLKKIANVKKNESLELGNNFSMQNAWDAINQKLNEFDVNEFKKHLFSNVQLAQMVLPPDTDLNHYFEVMNNRGEQLEKHEVLKARMMSGLKSVDQIVFAKIWDACADMDSYVQTNFTNTTKRSTIFGDDYNSIPSLDFDELVNKLTDSENKDDLAENKEITDAEISFTSIIGNKELAKSKDASKAEPKERFMSIIDFPNFLLHVLKIHGKHPDSSDKETFSLDDKKLLDEFGDNLSKDKDESKKWVKTFACKLLKTRFLFDKYIIKRESKDNKERWNILQYSKKDESTSYTNTFSNEEEQAKNKMIQAMLHVSYPSQNNKKWLTEALENLDKTNDEPDLFTTLRDYAKGQLEKIIANNKEVDETKLNQGTAVPHFVFHCLDFILWEKKRGEYENFEFKFRNSIEHFYPQNSSYSKGEIGENVHNFGNLAITTKGENSTWSNHSPSEKRNKIGEVNIPKQSLKFQLMILMLEQAKAWNEKTIKDHGDKMIKFLNEFILVVKSNKQ